MKDPKNNEQTCRVFVQEFYDWYIAKSNEQDHKTPEELGDEVSGPAFALKYKKDAFRPDLFNALNEDLEVKAKNSKYIEGLEFDPFFYTDEIPDRFVLGKSAVSGDIYCVEVYGIWGGRIGEQRTVVAELMFLDGRWVFVNFRNGDDYGETLLSDLKNLREERSRIQTKPDDSPNNKSCRAFVREFYDWYAGTDGKSRRTKDVVEYRSSSLSPELFRDLKEEEEIQARTSDEITGLDFDPIVGSQDGGDSFVVGDVTNKDDHYLVDVYGIDQNIKRKGPGIKRKSPGVTAELILKDGQWIFVNFHYPGVTGEDGHDLLTDLKELQDERQKQSK